MRFQSLLLALICTFSVGAQIEFIPNNGQFYDFDGNLHPEILYKVEQPNGNVYFKKDGLFFQFYSMEEKSLTEYTKEEREAYNRGDYAMAGHKVFYYQMDLDLLNTNPDVKVTAGSETAMVRNYYLAHCPDGIMNVKARAEVIYEDIYPNIDLRFYSAEGKIKYDFILYPGADPNVIQYAYKGYNELIVKDGAVKIQNPVTRYTDAAPIAFTESGEKVGVALNYAKDKQTFNYVLTVDQFDEKIIIDPTMEWGTYLNGTTSATWTRPVFDSNGAMYNAGYTSDASFPVLNAGAGQYFDDTKDGSNDLVVVKFNEDHSQAWATYYGGDMSDYLAGYTDYGKAIAINSSNEIYVAGLVQSGTSTFPTYDAGGGAWYQDQSLIYGETSFILKFNENGVRQWASMFQHENGASTSSEAIRFNGIVCDGAKLYFTGQLYNWNGSGIPIRTLTGAYNNSTYVGAQDPFIGRFDAGLDLEWCTYLNGGNPANQAYSQGVDLHIDGTGNLWFVGRETMGTAGSHVLMNPGGGAYYQNVHGGDQDLILSKFNSSMGMVWSTYYGGDGQDIPSMITTDNNDNPLIVCRSVKSTNWPTTDPGGGAYFSGALSGAGNQDSGILKFSNSGVATWCTYIAGTGNSNTMTGIGSDSNNNIYVSGSTNSSDWPVMNEAGSYYDGTIGGSMDAVFMRFSSGGVLEWSTYYGGTNNESLYSGKGALNASPCGEDFVAFGYTNSSDISFTDPGAGAYFQNTGATNNSYIFYFGGTGGSTSTDPSAINGPNAICEGETATLTVTGGTLNPIDDYVWYTGSCGGTQVGTGNSIMVSPTMATDYYVRAEGPCGETNCIMISITINSVDNAISSADGVNITASATGAQYQWVDCDNNFSAINGETGQSFMATANGNYAVIVTENNCTDTSMCYAVDIISVKEHGSPFGVSVYPNPTNGLFTVALNTIDSELELNITDAVGKVIFTNLLIQPTTAIDLSALSEGMYHVHIRSTNGEREALPIVIQR